MIKNAKLSGYYFYVNFSIGEIFKSALAYLQGFKAFALNTLFNLFWQHVFRQQVTILK